MRIRRTSFDIPVFVGAATVHLAFVGCTQSPALVHERSAVGASFTDTAWYRAHCVTTDTIRPNLSACLLRDQSPERPRFPGPPPLTPRRP